MHYITAFFHFARLDLESNTLDQIKNELEKKADELRLTGLLILGPEGINSTCAAPSDAIRTQYQAWIRERFQAPNICFKNSECVPPPFRRYKVKVRDEIVTTGIPGVLPPTQNNHHLTPDQWNEVINTDASAVLIDTRNWYEYEIGTFKGALNPNIEKFTEFPEYIKAQGIEKDRKMLIFCTGGIRCEKGILELQQQGYQNVYQLEGGILNYLEQKPNDQYQGECFVFDHRVAVDQHLQPSQKFGLCPHCGQPASQVIDCKRCDHPEKVCGNCLKEEFKKDTCSKNCAHQWKLYPGRKGARQLQPFELELMTERNEIPRDQTEIRITKKKVLRVNERGQSEIQAG